MNLLPVVGRELRVGARTPMTYRIRLYTVGISLALSLLIYVQSRFMPGTSAGYTLFVTLTVVAMMYALLEGARRTADVLSQEKREGTLGLLFLTDLKGYDVVLGKLTGSALGGFYALLSFFPVLALSLLMGGVTEGEFARVCAVLVNTLFFSLAAGMWISARSRHGHRAMGGAVGLVTGMSAVLPLVDLMIWQDSSGGMDRIFFSLASPAMGCFQAFPGAYQNAPERYWLSLAVMHLLGWICLWRACAIIGRQWRENERGAGMLQGGIEWLGRKFTSSKSGETATLLDQNPVTWLVRRQTGSRLPLWISFAVGAGALIWRMRQDSRLPAQTEAFLFGAVVSLAIWALLIHVSWLSCRWAVETREAGMMEMLLTTPLTVKGILSGQWTGLLHVIMWPVLALLVLSLFGWINSWMLAGDERVLAGGGNTQISVATTSPLELIGLLATVYAVSWMGMWFGLSARKPVQAAFKTVGFGIILPGVAISLISPFLAWGIFIGLNVSAPGTFSTILLCVTIVLEVAICLALARWAKRRLLRDFRRVAAGMGKGG